MGTQTRVRAMSRPTQTPVQLREKGRSALAAMNGVVTQLDEYDGENEDVLDATSALTRALASMQTTFVLMANSLEEAIAAKEMATSNDQEEAMLKMLEAATLHDAGDDGGGASRAKLEAAEDEIALLRSQIDAMRSGHDDEAMLYAESESLKGVVKEREAEIFDLQRQLASAEEANSLAQSHLEDIDALRAENERLLRSVSAVTQGMGDHDGQVQGLLEQIERGGDALRAQKEAYEKLKGENAKLAESHQALRTMLRNPKQVTIKVSALPSLQAAFPDAVIGEHANKAHTNIPK